MAGPMPISPHRISMTVLVTVLFFPLPSEDFKLEKLCDVPSIPCEYMTWENYSFPFSGSSSLSFILLPQNYYYQALEEGRAWWNHDGGGKFSALSISSFQIAHSQPRSPKSLLNRSQKVLSLTARRQRKIIHTKNKLCHESFDFAFS